MPRIPLLLALCAAFGCGSEDGGGSQGGSAQGGVDVCDDSAKGVTCGFDQDGNHITAEDFIDQCQAIADPEGCQGRWWTENGEPPGSQYGVYGAVYCTWIQWAEVNADTCEFAPAGGECLFGVVSDGCSLSMEDDARWCMGNSEDIIFVRDQGNGPELGRVASCDPRGVEAVGQCQFKEPFGEHVPEDPDEWNYPVCACLCDPDFPPLP